MALIALVTEEPAVTDLLPEFVSEKSNGCGWFTVKPNAVVLETPPPDAVTVMVELPPGVDPLVLRVSVEEQLRLQLFGEKEAVVPEGNPEAENVTGCVLPETNVALIALVTDEPAVTDLFPELESEKSNVWSTARLKIVVLLTPVPVPLTVIG